MHKTTIVLLTLALLGAAAATSCSQKITQVKADEALLVTDTHCPDCFSTKKMVRSRAMRESTDQQMALQMARSSALEDLASKINVAVKSVVDDYYSSRTVNQTEETKRRFEGLTRQAVDQSVRGYRTACERYTVSRRSDGTKVYKCYLVLEISKDDLASSLYQGLGQGERQTLDMEYEKFRAVFDREMERADNNR